MKKCKHREEPTTIYKTRKPSNGNKILEGAIRRIQRWKQNPTSYQWSSSGKSKPFGKNVISEKRVNATLSNSTENNIMQVENRVCEQEMAQPTINRFL